MSSVDWSPELASALNGLIPLDDGSRANWDDVLARAGARHGLRLRRTLPRWRVRLAIAVALLLLLLAGVATATYFALRGSTGLAFLRTKDGSLAVIDANGRPRTVWNCRRPDRWCGYIVSVAWSPDGKRLALSTSEVGAESTYPGLHIIDLETGTDRRIPPVQRYVGNASPNTLRREVLRDIRILGCYTPDYVSWSPDGSEIAYSCLDTRARSPRHWRTRIYTIRPDGTGRSLVWTPHIQNALALTWSPDNTSIAFSTCELPVMYKNRFNLTRCKSSVFVVDLDGRHMRRLVDGALPDWSPDGRTIAYIARVCGRARIRLVTLDGLDATPSSGRCAGIGPLGSVVAAWSPDGGRIAVATRHALYVMNADGSGLERFRRGNFINRGPGGLIKPLWRPSPKGG